MKCGPDDDQRCPWNLNYIIYPTCEGKQQCGASGLRILGLDNVCRNRSFVLVDYICVQSKFDSDDLVYNENSKELRIIVKSDSETFPKYEESYVMKSKIATRA